MTIKTAEPLLGGLNTKLPPVMMDRQFSPDLLNVIPRDGTMQKRGGFTPLFKDRLRLDCIENVPFITTSRSNNSAGSTDGEFVTSVGYLAAGHRSIYDQNDPALSFALWFQPTRLTASVGGNGENALGGVFRPAPYTVKVQPIFSKGPIRKSDTYVPVAATEWGTATNSGMPFCLYLFNSGTGTSPVWSFRLSAHVFTGGVWTLQTVTSTVPVVEGGKYHILGAVSNSRVALRIRRVRDGNETLVYTQDATSFTGQLASNKCPLQVFDCPQSFITATNVGTATQRPGLNLNNQPDGGYWWAKLRALGRVDEIAVYAGDLTLSTLERTNRIAYTGQAGLINLWSMGGDAIDYVREETGRGNHLFFVPRGPISVRDDAGKEGGSWWFNGTTSYAEPSTDTPNWRMYDGATKPAVMNRLVRDNMEHGIAVEFWPDSIEPQAQQVVAEIHSVLLLAIRADGRIVGYCRDGAVSAPPAALIGDTYQGPVVSNVTIVPGQRYSIALVRRDGGTILDLYVDNVLDASLAGLNPNNYQTVPTSGNSHAPSGISLGMGSLQRMIRGASMDDPAMAHQNLINTDSASGFVGRIETFRIITTREIGTLVKRHGPEGPEDWRFPESRLFENPVLGLRDRLKPDDEFDTVRNVGRGKVPHVISQREGGMQVGSVISDSTASPVEYRLSGVTMTGGTAGTEGHTSLEAIGARIYHTFAYYRLNVDDREAGYAGAYRLGMQLRYTGGGALVTDPIKHTHIQFSALSDAVGMIGQMFRCCNESDITNDAASLTGGTATSSVTHRQRPYAFRSPKELGLQWFPSFVDPQPGSAPVSMLAEYEDQDQRRRVMLTSCGRSIYWAKPAWEADGSLLLPGGVDSFLRFTTDTTPDTVLLSGTSPKNTVVVSVWLKPIRLDGIRVIAQNRIVDEGLTVDALTNWLIYSDNGAIVVAGVEGPTPSHWRFIQGVTTGGATDVRRLSSFKVGQWNHLHVTMGTTTVTVRVNGQIVPMVQGSTLAGSLQCSAFGSGDSSGLTNLLVGGSPDGFERIVLPNTVGSVLTLQTESWFGGISDLQIRSSVDSTRWPAGVDGYPMPRGQVDATADYAWLLNEGDGWLLENSIVATSQYRGDVNVREFLRVASGLEQEAGGHYEAVAFRDSLLVTNGADRPRQIIFNGLFATSLFEVRQIGIDAPVPLDVDITTTTTAGTTVTNANYLISTTFLTADGRESEATLIGSFDVTGGPYGSILVTIDGLPRSTDPQVVSRRVYMSPIGGGDPLSNRDVFDNDSYTIDVSVTAAAGVSPPAGTNLPSPRARQIAIAGASLVLADLPDEPAGQNLLAFSTPDEVHFFTTASTAAIDSVDGRPIVGIAHNLGQVFLSKRNSIHQLDVGALVAADQVEASVRLVQSSDGIGGGTAAASNLVYGAGDRGVFVFNNTSADYLTDMIEPTWRNLDLSDRGLYRMRGAFLRPHSQYWISTKRRTDTENNAIYVLDLQTRSWVVLTVPAHRTMAVVDRPDQFQVLAIGTANGSILQYDDEELMDASDADLDSDGAATIEGSAGLSGSSTSLTMSGANFATTLGGLRGAIVKLVHDGITEDRAITWNSETSIRWEQPLTGWTSFTSFSIGDFQGYWTSPWIGDTPISRSQKLSRVGIKMLPIDGDLQLDISAIVKDESPSQLFPTTADRMETFQVPMLRGYENQPRVIREQAQGRYHRLRFGTYGHRDPFALISFDTEIMPSETLNQPGRLT